jgi:hypothetical protein
MDFIIAPNVITLCANIVLGEWKAIYTVYSYAQISLVPLAGEDSGIPVNMMREQLAQKHGVDNVDELTMDEVEE